MHLHRDAVGSETLLLRGLYMKRLILAVASVAALTAPALAADMAVKARLVAPVA